MTVGPGAGKPPPMLGSKTMNELVTLLGDISAGVNRGEPLRVEKRMRLFHVLQNNEGKLNNKSPYDRMLVSAAYYLCGMKDVSKDVASVLECPDDIEGGGIEYLLTWVLKYGKVITTAFGKGSGVFAEYIDDVVAGRSTSGLLKAVYDHGTPRQLLLGDIVCAILKD